MKYATILFQFFKSNFKYIILFILGAIAWSLIPKCSNPIPVTNDPIKIKIKQEIKATDSLKKIAKKTDSIRIVEIHHWHQAKETIKYLPCDSAIKIIVHVCDTLIKVDSTEIVELRRVIVQDSLTIKDLFTEVKNDSLVIVGLNKSLKRQKLKTKLVALGLGGLLGYSVFRK